MRDLTKFIFNQYQEECREFAFAKTLLDEPWFNALALAEEVGEMIEKLLSSINPDVIKGYPTWYWHLQRHVTISKEMGALKKRYRDYGKYWEKQTLPNDSESYKITMEGGDSLFYLNYFLQSVGTSLAEAADHNLGKISSRKERGVQHGSGDNR